MTQSPFFHHHPVNKNRETTEDVETANVPTEMNAVASSAENGVCSAKTFTIEERRHLFRNEYKFYRPPHYSTFYDHDAWIYGLEWPQSSEVLPFMSKISVVADDIKFASNAWTLLRICAFYGLPHPRVLSDLSSTTPSMAIDVGGNWQFHKHAEISSSLSPRAAKVALMASHPKAVSLGDCDWHYLADTVSQDGTVEIVLGMENGMRADIVEQCDAWLSIPQYGSCGSLSMLSALTIVLHHAAAALHPLASQIRTFIGSSAAPKISGGNENDSQLSPPQQSNAGSASTSTSASVSKFTREGLQQSSASGLLAVDAEIGWLKEERRKRAEDDEEVDNNEDGSASRVHAEGLLGLDDKAISRLLAERRARLPLQLATYHYNEAGDQNIGAIIRNGNIYNFEKMVIVGRKKFSRRGSVGTHNYANICFHDTFESADADTRGYAMWLLHNPFPYLCNRSDEILPHWQLPKEVSVGRKAAKEMPGAYIRLDNPSMKEWLAADERATLTCFPEYGKDTSQLNSPIMTQRQEDVEDYMRRLIEWSRMAGAGEQHNSTTGNSSSCDFADVEARMRLQCEGSALTTDWERSHPMYGPVSDVLRPTVHLDDEVTILEAVIDVKRRGLKGIMLVVPEEGSTTVWPVTGRCERVVTIVHPARVCSLQRGMTPAVSTAIALERLREATLMIGGGSL